jgi:hypothetical protein
MPVKCATVDDQEGEMLKEHWSRQEPVVGACPLVGVAADPSRRPSSGVEIGPLQRP